MTLGDVKTEVLLMMGFEDAVCADNVGDLDEDENWGALLRQVPGAVNRCFADLESKRVLPLRRASLPSPTGKGTWRRFRYDEIEGLFEVVRVVVETNYHVDDDHPFLLDEGGTLRVTDYDDTANYAVLFRPKLPRMTAASGNDIEIPLPDVLAAAVPYFVKSEIYRGDEPDEAGEARNFYEAAVEQYAQRMEIERQGTVQTVYGGYW